MTKTQIMAKLGAQSDLDLLEHIPARYDDMAPTIEKPADRYQDGEKARLHVKVLSVRASVRMQLIRFTAGGEVSDFRWNFIVFHQMFYLNRIAMGKELFVVAYYSARQRAFMVSGIYENDSRFVLSQVRPYYHLPKEISQSTFASVIDNILLSQYMMYVKDKVPSFFVDKYHLLPRDKAFRYIHAPANKKELALGIRNFKYEECLAYCLKIKANRRYVSLLKKNSLRTIDTQKVNELILSLPFKLTHDQVVAVREIVTDMKGPKVMYRLLQGDVSTGKTIVALIALYANWLRGGQGILFSPTTSLAQQHYANANKFLMGKGPKIGLLLSGMKAEDRRNVIRGLADGSIAILVATEAGISADVRYKNLTLSVIDEQQSFGVEQRAEMIAKGQAVDTLMMTATPIPRTVAIMKTGDMDLSELHQFPNGSKRLVRTQVIKSTDPILKKAIEQAVAKGRQVFVIVPRIDEAVQGEEDSGKVSAKQVYEEYGKLYGFEKVQLLHGRIKASEQARILEAFKDKSKPILVATSVVEVGMDIKDAGLMIIYSANLFGLSALHQLRGRIGRNGHFALALLVYDGKDAKAQEKLEFLAHNNDGFAISEYDLKSRGFGSIGGLNQSGESDLALADFTTDYAMFKAGMGDADLILDKMALVPEFRDYAQLVIKEAPIRSALLI